MDVYDDYEDDDDDDGHESSGDSDDNEVKFVSAKRRFQYTTFGDSRSSQEEDQEATTTTTKDASIYGVFAEPPASSFGTSRASRNATTSSTPKFVKSSAKHSDIAMVPETKKEKQDFQPASKPDILVQPEDERPKDAQLDDLQDEESKEVLEVLRKKQEEANQKFFALLGRGRGEKRKLRHDGPTEFERQTNGGLGFQASGGGLGFQSGSHQEGGDSFVGGGLGYNSATTTEVRGGLGFSAAGAAEDENPSMSGLGSSPFTFGKQQPLPPPPPPPMKVDPNLGKWERHTKGIGLKLLAKMGYTGSGGLGAKRKKTTTAGETVSQSGISRPVEVVVRPNNLGLGFGNFKEATKLKANQQIEAEIRGEKIPEKKRMNTAEGTTGGPSRRSSALPSTSELLKEQFWKRGAKQISQKRQRRSIIPYKEILEKQKQPAIIDMRGPAATSNDAGEVPLAEELLHNVSILLNTYENKLHSNSHFLQASKQKLKSLQSDLNQMENRRRDGQERMEKLKKVLRVVDSIDNIFKSSNGGVDIDATVHKLVEELRDGLSEEDRIALQFDQVLVPSLLDPLIESKLDQWDPLVEGPGRAESVINSLMALGSSNDDDDDVKQERRLSTLSRNILPKVTSSFDSTKWNPLRDVESGIALYEAALAALKRHSSNPIRALDDTTVFPTGDPDHISLDDVLARELLRGTIFPKLMRLLSQWKPELDDKGENIAYGLEAWLLPWMPHLDHPATSTQLASDLKRKLRSSLSCLNRGVMDKRDFIRASVATVTPWRSILQKETLHDLTSKYITPRLVKSFSRFSVSLNPSEQDWFDVDALVSLYDRSLLSRLEFISLMESEVLTEWARELHNHLSKQQALEVEYLVESYTAWKHKVFGIPSSTTYQVLQSDEFCCRIFYTCLQMISASVSGRSEELASLAPHASRFREVVARRAKDEQHQSEEELERLQAKDAIEFRKHVMSRQLGGTATFREVVEDFAREHDISFRPRTGGRNMTDDGKPIFMFGSVSIYLDVDVIFALQNGEWKPVSIEQLSSMAS